MVSSEMKRKIVSSWSPAGRISILMHAGRFDSMRVCVVKIIFLLPLLGVVVVVHLRILFACAIYIEVTQRQTPRINNTKKNKAQFPF